jgi:hypothetical protein
VLPIIFRQKGDFSIRYDSPMPASDDELTFSKVTLSEDSLSLASGSFDDDVCDHFGYNFIRRCLPTCPPVRIHPSKPERNAPRNKGGSVAKLADRATAQIKDEAIIDISTGWPCRSYTNSLTILIVCPPSLLKLSLSRSERQTGCLSWRATDNYLLSAGGRPSWRLLFVLSEVRFRSEVSSMKRLSPECKPFTGLPIYPKST